MRTLFPDDSMVSFIAFLGGMERLQDSVSAEVDSCGDFVGSSAIIYEGTEIGKSANRLLQ